MQKRSPERQHQYYLNWKNRQTPEQYEAYKEKNRLNKQKKFNENPKKVRKQNALNAKKRRAEKRKESREYIANYYHERMKNDPDFYLRHSIATTLNQIMKSGSNPNAFTNGSYKPKSPLKFIDKRAIYDHLIKLGWEKGKNSIDHIIPMNFLLANGFKDIKILMEPLNLQVLTMKNNSSKYNYIKYDYQLDCARKLENKFPVECKGLTVLVAQELEKGIK